MNRSSVEDYTTISVYENILRVVAYYDNERNRMQCYIRCELDYL